MPLERTMKHPEVISLFKYHGFNVNSLKCLIDEVAWFAKPASFNDPFDCGIYIDEDKKEESINEVIEEQLQFLVNTGQTIKKEHTQINQNDVDAFNSFRRDVYELMQSIGIYCLSSCNNDILMWGHYADSHTGFCIEYERTETNILGKQAFPVTYQEELPSLSGRQVSSKGSEFDQLWTVKSSHWKYEKEWRVMSEVGGKAFRFPCKVKSIIFGVKMTEANKYTIKKLFSNSDVTFKQAKLDSRKFALNIVQIEA